MTDPLADPLPWSDFLQAVWPLWLILAALVVLRLCRVRL